MAIKGIYLPVGRFVSGSLTEPRTRDYQNRPIPEDKQRYEWGVAVPKDATGIQDVFNKLHEEAMTVHSQHPSVVAFNLKGYSWKVNDGDEANAQGKVNENHQGCWVFYFSSSFPPNVVDVNNVKMDSRDIKRGYYIDMVFGASNNELTGDRAGIYLNPEFVRFVAFGEEIRGGRSAADAFANAPAPVLPSGASSTPVPNGPPPSSGGPQGATGGGAVSPPASPPSAPAVGPVGTPPVAPAPAPQAAPQATTASPSSPAPAHDYVNNHLPGMPR